MAADAYSGAFGTGESRSVSMIGSFDMDYQVTAVDGTSGKAVVSFHVQNVMDQKSLLRNPLADRKSAKRNGPKTGRTSPITMHVYWTEVIDF
ncbi:hypothetical protein ACFQFC_00525 [Amorphoplanes digitatis]|uniref:Uncharacterized protein n=1 Tax=Actinoplanes digitatis TaxID=1868 RepID=A0A7W7HXN4_9ACTN|nr:hypothetical protein [Actinoplanes digitatis]MBB4762661.1 hypothetical protein [Actinoplanes digitatis]BFE71552.1 hypothetical protein GCM10020092_048530 [Actinoplanes digitatis]GID91840.1 hypothetical protein Adi01nite_12520 [Actinoplanes digitatis]